MRAISISILLGSIVTSWGCGRVEFAPCTAGLACDLPRCPAGTTTGLTGTVYAPNGTLPLAGVDVYIAASDPGPIVHGPSCARCGQLAGDPVAATVTGIDGSFALSDLPANVDLELVVQIGSWRRIVGVPHVAPCVVTALDPEQTRLPRDHTEGDLPHIAVTTSDTDGLECVLYKLGIADAEFTTDADAGSVHLFAGDGGNAVFEPGFASTGTFADATTLWDTVDKLAQYDAVLVSCQGYSPPENESAAAYQAMHDYIDLGGRAMVDHFESAWLTLGPSPWPAIATFTTSEATLPMPTTVSVEESTAYGADLAAWMDQTGGSVVDGQLVIDGGRNSCEAVDPTVAATWLTLDPTLAAGFAGVQAFTFGAPIEAAPDARCGKVTFTDMHAESDSVVGDQPFPIACAGPLDAEQTALAYLLFETLACSGRPDGAP